LPDYNSIEIQGHRGARGHYPENTIVAFTQAMLLGADVLEMDVVISKDKKVIVSHEAWMNELICRKPGGFTIEGDPRENHNLYKMPAAVIQTYDCGLRGHPDFPLQKKIATNKPLLSEAIVAVEAFTQKQNLRAARYNIEIKSEVSGDGIFHPTPQEFVQLIIETINALQISGRFNLQSFDPRILLQIKKNNPEIPLALLVENQKGLQENLALLDFIPEIYSPEFYLVTPQLVKEVHNLNMKLIPWTVNEVNDIEQLMIMGVDGIISDYPDRALQVKKQRSREIHKL
jgi:glycerophosphoryl diester phosphodiesterase